MPRKSAASLTVINPSGLPNRLRPPSSLSAAERTVFLDIVGSNDPNKFHQSDAVLLCCYVEAICMEQRAAKELRKSPVLKGKVSPWITVQEKAVRAIVSLSMRLRLSPQARAPNNPGSKRQQPISYYEEARLDRE
jgi:phage terminase small subunit